MTFQNIKDKGKTQSRLKQVRRVWKKYLQENKTGVAFLIQNGMHSTNFKQGDTGHCVKKELDYTGARVEGSKIQ